MQQQQQRHISIVTVVFQQEQERFRKSNLVLTIAKTKQDQGRKRCKKFSYAMVLLRNYMQCKVIWRTRDKFYKNTVFILSCRLCLPSQDILMVKYAGKYGKRKGVYRPLVRIITPKEMLPDVEVKDVHYVTSSANRCTLHVGLFKCLVNSADYNFISETNRKQNYQQHYHDADDELIDMRVSFTI
uniref:Uncharacterized protein n=1 Tax=Glossina austeni TaxID=7395 RepID=A0A1A9VLR2_GLOAU